jgi:hypothetical protein
LRLNSAGTDCNPFSAENEAPTQISSPTASCAEPFARFSFFALAVLAQSLLSFSGRFQEPNEL